MRLAVVILILAGTVLILSRLLAVPDIHRPGLAIDPLRVSTSLI